MGGGVGVGGGGADENRGGGSGIVRERSVVPVGPRVTGGAGGVPSSSCPHVTQKRWPRWFAVPQRGHCTSGVVGAAPSRGGKLICGASGR